MVRAILAAAVFAFVIPRGGRRGSCCSRHDGLFLRALGLGKKRKIGQNATEAGHRFYLYRYRRHQRSRVDDRQGQGREQWHRRVP